MSNLKMASLEEFSPDAKPTLFEAKGGLNLRFKFAESDIINANKRKYPHKTLSGAIGKAQNKIDAGSSIFGSCDHVPTMGVNDISHRLTKLEMKDKQAWAEAAVLKTDRGRNLTAIIEGGGAVGISMRGTGSVLEGIVQPNYELHGIDVVLSPSFDAHVSAANVFESEQFSPERSAEDEKVLRAFYENAIRSGYQKSYSDFRTEYFKRGVSK